MSDGSFLEFSRPVSMADLGVGSCRWVPARRTAALSTVNPKAVSPLPAAPFRPMVARERMAVAGWLADRQLLAMRWQKRTSKANRIFRFDVRTFTGLFRRLLRARNAPPTCNRTGRATLRSLLQNLQ